MSRSLNGLSLLIRCIHALPSSSVLAPPRTASAVLRRSMHMSSKSVQMAARRGNVSGTPAMSMIVTRHGHSAVQQRPQFGVRDEAPHSTSDASAVDAEAQPAPKGGAMESRFARHLHEQFTPLNFPPELARRILTHGSHDKAANDGHNARLAFIGRRVMQTYTSLLLHSSPACDPSHDHEFIVSRTLNTYALGQYVAPHLQLARIVRWRPTVNPEISKRAQFKYTKDVPAHFEGGEEGKDIAREVDPELMVAIKSHPAVMRSVGLYKVMGEAVEALIGGTYHQFGGTVALRMFHTRVLPHLLLTGPLGLHPAYHADAFNKAQEMAKTGLVPVRAAAAQ